MTEESLTQCVSEIRDALGDTEQRIIKTLPRRGYVFAAQVQPTAAVQVGATAQMVESVPRASEERPCVTVLPFANLSGDAAQEYLSDGITEDVINGLSYFSELSVIARNSSFSYKGHAIDVRHIGRDLGAHYIVEGSARRFGGRIRITAQLIDAQSGIRRWAERFDREIGEVFAVQDEITRAVISIVVAHVGRAERERVSRKVPSSWTAYDLLMQGQQALRAYESSWAPEHLYEARRLLADAYKADPADAGICALLGHTYIRGYAEPRIEELGDQRILERGYELISKAVSLDPNSQLVRAHLGWTLFWMHKPEGALAEYDKAFAINPNFSDWRFPVVVVYAGMAERALELVQAQIRLDPFHPPHTHAFQGHALYMLRRYREALTPLRECIRRGPDVLLGHVWLAATLIRLGESTEAKQIMAGVLRRAPLMTLARWRAPTLYRNSQDSIHMIEALREAGLV